MKKSYKWIVSITFVAVVCIIGSVIRERYDTIPSLNQFSPVDYENYDVREALEKADDGREEYIIKVNINSATAQELAELPKIGAATAQKIVDYRNDYGDFVNIEEIKSVKDIGDKTYAAISKYLTVE